MFDFLVDVFISPTRIICPIKGFNHLAPQVNKLAIFYLSKYVMRIKNMFDLVILVFILRLFIYIFPDSICSKKELVVRLRRSNAILLNGSKRWARINWLAKQS